MGFTHISEDSSEIAFLLVENYTMTTPNPTFNLSTSSYNNMAKKALITGATGLLGRQVVKAFQRKQWEVIGTGFTRAHPPAILKLDLSSEADVVKVLDEVKPQVIVHCAANRFPDKCENDPEGTRALNTTASGTLAKHCAANSIILIYISTDYVFPGTEGDAPYEVTHTPSPPNLYGVTKHDGEKAILAEYKKAGKDGLGVVLRVPVLYGEADTPSESAVNTLMTSVWKAGNKDAGIKMDHWSLRYPTNTEDVGRVCQGISRDLIAKKPTDPLPDIATKYLATDDKSSLPTTLQFSSEDKFTKYEICQLFAEIMGLPLDGMTANAEGNDPNASVQRPYNTHLSTKALQDLGIDVSTMDFAGPEIIPGTPPPKYSRYRSVRGPDPKPLNSPPLDPPDGAMPTITKSMSRYRRPRGTSRADQGPLESRPPIPAMPPHAPSKTSTPSRYRDVARRATDPVPASQHQISAGDVSQESGNESRHKVRDEEDRYVRQWRSRKEHEEQERIEPKNDLAAEVEKAPLDEEEIARRLAEQQRKELERLEAELEAAVPTSSQGSRDSGEGKFTLFSRKRSATLKSPPLSSGGLPATKPRGTDEPQIPQQGIQQGGGGIVPGTDAPISAVNAGERRVLIRCKQSSINLPITPDTTPVDIILSAANILSQNIDRTSAILLESYTQLGLERRVRRYEHIRDIMNSWDRDTQNALIIQNSDTPEFDVDLEASSVPREAPEDVTVHMYHSQKPGKWNKRYITLQSSGQIYISKNSNAKPSDKDVSNICHLSDFDIYTPTSQQKRRELKPPKKHCYAIKSQQKTTMFLSTENFVHFFSAENEAVADRWYSAVQSWRSWYLVNKMGEGQKKTCGKGVKQITTEARRPGTSKGVKHTVKVSVDLNPYTLGSFAPLIDMERFESPKESPEYDSDDENRPLQIPFHLRNNLTGPPPRESKRHPPPVTYRVPVEEGDFASGGLLGRTYSQRQRSVREREGAPQFDGPFIDGPSLLNRAATGSRQRSQSSGSDKNSLNGSRREMPRPLLDFTPEFKEAPQWDKKGKGRGVAPPSGVPLVEVATTPETGLADIPKGTLFRRDVAPLRPVTAKAAYSSDGFVKGGLISGIS
ncbi:hypothetical protein B7494_g4409 [Chlorociboria aeruginascens]|nr:hypothetical protein B7494_g4409 [Chlorociboria aeruginascens]